MDITISNVRKDFGSVAYILQTERVIYVTRHGRTAFALVDARLATLLNQLSMLSPKTEFIDRVLAYKVFGIYKDYNAKVPDTIPFVLVKNYPIAQEVIRILNMTKDGSVKYNGVIFDNLEFLISDGLDSSYKIRDELTLSLERVAMTPEQALKIINGEE